MYEQVKGSVVFQVTWLEGIICFAERSDVPVYIRHSILAGNMSLHTTTGIIFCYSVILVFSVVDGQVSVMS